MGYLAHSQDDNRVDLEVSDPSPLNQQQEAWLNAHVQAFYSNLFSAGFADPSTGYASYIDVDSFVNYFILSETTRNLDSYIRSFYFYEDRAGKVTVGPLWDYDLIAGAGLSTSVVTNGWQHAITRNASANGWLQRLITDPAFWSRVTTRYCELRTGVLSQASIEDRIARLSGALANAATRNFQRWPNLRQQTIVYFTTPTANTWQGQLDAMNAQRARTIGAPNAVAFRQAIGFRVLDTCGDWDYDDSDGTPQWQ